MARRERYSDTFTGKSDMNIRAVLGADSEDDGVNRLKRILLNVINNGLTPRQKEIIVLYYFKELNTVEIAERLGITPQAVSAVMSRARMRIFKTMKHYF